MDRPLQILYLEDNQKDVLLVKYTLQKGGVSFTLNSVNSKENFLSALEKDRYDIILSDYAIPSYSGTEALEYVRAHHPSIPFIFITGLIKEENAIENLKNGATDYIAKERLVRLVPSVLRAYTEALDKKEKKLALAELVNLEFKYKSICENAIEGIFQTTPQGQILFVNPALARMHGFTSSEEMIRERTNIGEQIYADPKKRIEYIKLIEETNFVKFEFEALRRDGSNIWFYEESRAIRNNEGEILYYEGFVIDITERKKIEEALAESNKRLEGIISSALDGIITIDEETNIILFNNSAEKMFNTSSKHVLGKKINVLFPDFKLEDYLTYASPIFNNDNIIYGIRNGDERFAMEASVSLLTEKNKYYTIIFRDITDRKRTEKRLYEINEELETFMYRSSHNLKGPSASLLGLISIAKMEVRDYEALKYIQLIEKSSMRLEATLDELLTVSRIKQSPVELDSIKISALIEKTIEKLKEKSRLGHAEFDIRAEVNNHFVCDRTLLFYILYNLLDNSIKHSKINRHPIIKILCKEAPNNLQIEVSDNGIGIPDHCQEKVFEMFYRANENSKGIGLGLYLVKCAVEKLQGQIFCSSQENVGSTFSILLPNLSNSISKISHPYKKNVA